MHIAIVWSTLSCILQIEAGFKCHVMVPFLFIKIQQIDWILGLFFITVLINFLENFLNKSGFFSLDCNVPLPFVLDGKGLQIKYS